MDYATPSISYPRFLYAPGALAAAITNPLDVVKTRQQTECVKTCAKKLEHANNVYRCLTHIAAKEGYANNSKHNHNDNNNINDNNYNNNINDNNYNNNDSHTHNHNQNNKNNN
jgi:hypothetical protein